MGPIGANILVVSILGYFLMKQKYSCKRSIHVRVSFLGFFFFPNQLLSC